MAEPFPWAFSLLLHAVKPSDSEPYHKQQHGIDPFEADPIRQGNTRSRNMYVCELWSPDESFHSPSCQAR